MISKTKPVEERIREHYTAQNGEWLVEKGKVKEAKLLKEACIKLEQQGRALEKLNDEKWNKQWENVDRSRELDKREKALEELEKRLQNRLNSLFEDVQRWTKEPA